MAPTAYFPNRPGSWAGGGAATTGGSAAMLLPLPLKRLLPLLVGLRRRRLELRGDPVYVLRVLQEVLEQTPLTLRSRCSEGRRLHVRHVEDHGLRGLERRLGGPRDRVRVHAWAHLLVSGPEATGLGPRRGRLRRREVADERLDRRCVAEGDDRVAGDLDGAGAGAGVDGREDRRIEAGVGFCLRRR